MFAFLEMLEPRIHDFFHAPKIGAQLSPGGLSLPP